ncbi:hypothetical protein AJ78_07326 [Emergomyces pasteurianus Ep9510]|uniref:Uncharacterized protein n=1 Tax=Emergomyces pasteurianus Ep9510 TaxID=1447872 RepID=A0A1J9Q735_9EURO|nr:hypothetical protein AJ78_07326 [Emergomyces pasteurianus Ep9510]
MSQSSPIKSERRVLVEKSTNASLTPSRSQSTTKSSISSISPPVLAGQKRSIDQVDSAQNRSSSTKSSFSQIRREEEFYIYEENNTQSSTDVDIKQIMPSSFLQTSRSFDQEIVPNPTTSQQSDTMSSLLNLSFESESNKSSPNSSLKRPTQAIPTTTTTAPTPASTVPTDPVERKAFIQQKASLLRTRVQSAMKSIKTPQNQIDRRLSALEMQASSRDRPCLPHPLRFFPHPPNNRHTLPQQQHQHQHLQQQETADVDEGDEDLTPRAKIPKLLPAPILHPTAYSARYAPTNTMLSSPPASATGENYGERMETEMDEHGHGHGHEHAENEWTPTQAKGKDYANSANNISGTANANINSNGNGNGNASNPPPETPTSPMQPCSPPHTGDSPIVIERNAKMCSVDQMIAKAKKGEAVDGLLKLMKTTTEYDKLDEWTG